MVESQTSFPRIKGKQESPTKKQIEEKPHKETLGRQGRKVHCSSCGKVGYNASGCKNYPITKEKEWRKGDT